MTLDDLLNSPQFKQALFDVQVAECERFAATSEPVTFSPKFERKMERLLRAQRKPYYLLTNTKPKRVVLALVTALILMVTMVFSVSALREPVIHFFVEVYEKFSQVFFQNHEEEQFPATLEVYYVPTWLPDGYWEDAEQTIDAIIFCERTYTDADRVEITFKQHTITSSVLRIDTENVQTKQALVNGQAALVYSNKEIQHLIWNDGAYGFLVFGPVKESDLLRMAEAIQPVKK